MHTIARVISYHVISQQKLQQSRDPDVIQGSSMDLANQNAANPTNQTPDTHDLSHLFNPFGLLGSKTLIILFKTREFVQTSTRNLLQEKQRMAERREPEHEEPRSRVANIPFQTRRSPPLPDPMTVRRRMMGLYHPTSWRYHLQPAHPTVAETTPVQLQQRRKRRTTNGASLPNLSDHPPPVVLGGPTMAEWQPPS